MVGGLSYKVAHTILPFKRWNLIKCCLVNHHLRRNTSSEEQVQPLFDMMSVLKVCSFVLLGLICQVVPGQLLWDFLTRPLIAATDQKCHVDKCTMLIKSGKNGVHISCILVQHDLISLISLPFGTFNIMIDQVVILRKARGLCRRLPVVDPKNWMLKTRQAGTFCRLIRMRSLVVF
ncbi:hypothetical protein CIPAW_14G089500 [Carya illinoinensis]|uniref:Uncharacterized protein n=1 Tax=Carya illinoinensis TaxID=32201 RepID=A0A8T1NIA4_CARIL|nr:hypothetical protein CIPAW_14G089500 [Carya illinoinensis]KAG6629501.1 hypothetical protein CIPAW_14G089500 [Carya illinoinensis]